MSSVILNIIVISCYIIELITNIYFVYIINKNQYDIKYNLRSFLIKKNAIDVKK